MGKTAGSAAMWQERDESLGNEDLYTCRMQLRKAISRSINHSIMVITCRLCTYHNTRIIAYQIGWHNFLHACKNSKYQTPCMQKFEVAKGSHAPARVGAENRWTIHIHVVHASPLARPSPMRRASVRVWFFLFLSPIASTRWR
jgi:hypothetical protein